MMTISVQELERELPAIMERKLNPKASYHTDLPDVSEIPAPLRPGQCNWQPLPHLPLWSRVTWGSTTPCKMAPTSNKIEFHGYISPKIMLFSNTIALVGLLLCVGILSNIDHIFSKTRGA